MVMNTGIPVVPRRLLRDMVYYTYDTQLDCLANEGLHASCVSHPTMKILIVEDHPIFREILQRILTDWFVQATVVCANDGTTAIRHLQEQSFTHLLLDLQLTDIDGFEVADTAKKSIPDIRIITLTSHCDEYTVYRAEKLRIRGFVDKRTAIPFNFHQAIANVEADGVYYSPSFLRLKQERMKNSMSFDKILSERELSMLELIATPFSDREIATELGLSPNTVEKHRFNILRKLGLNTTTELVRFARLRGIVRTPRSQAMTATPRWNPAEVVATLTFLMNSMVYLLTQTTA